VTDPVEVDVDVVLPDEPPILPSRGARALLRILIAAAEPELGVDWRSRIDA
jgi:hypothetical protein